MLRLSYRPKQLKISEIILIPIPGKDPKELTSYCPQSTKYLRSRSIFLDVSQAFDKVWHARLLFKVKKVFPIQYFRQL
jgi:hypothetical protein